MSQDFLPYGKQTITEADLAAVREALQAQYLTTGPKVGEFEAAFANCAGAAHAVACANGTAALHIAFIALGIAPGDIVLAPSQSFLASANGPGYCGARIVFIDCDPDTGLVTRQTFLEAVGRAGGPVKAAVIVHLNGEHADMAGIAAEAGPRGIRLVEDACHAIGTRFAHDGAMAQVGACVHSDLACFSLHPVKTITMGEGGVVTTNDGEMARRMRLARSHGLERDAARFTNTELAFDNNGAANPWYYEMAEPGYNYRATDFACALGLSQLAQLPHFIDRRKALKARYDGLFTGFHRQVSVVKTAQDCDPCRHLYPVLIDFEVLGMTRADVAKKLHALGVGTQVHYIPIHWQPFYKAQNPGLTLPGAEEYYRRALSLPLYPLMQDADCERVAEALRAVLGQAK